MKPIIKIEQDEDTVSFYVGTWHEPVASLWKAPKSWKIVFWLPGVRVSKEYDTLENQKAAALRQIEYFYAAAFETGVQP